MRGSALEAPGPGKVDRRRAVRIELRAVVRGRLFGKPRQVGVDQPVQDDELLVAQGIRRDTGRMLPNEGESLPVIRRDLVLRHAEVVVVRVFERADERHLAGDEVRRRDPVEDSDVALAAVETVEQFEPETLVFGHRVENARAHDGLLAQRAGCRGDPALVHDGHVDADVVPEETQRPGVFESGPPEDAQEVRVGCAPQRGGKSEEPALELSQHLLELGDGENLGEDLVRHRETNQFEDNHLLVPIEFVQRDADAVGLRDDVPVQSAGIVERVQGRVFLLCREGVDEADEADEQLLDSLRVFVRWLGCGAIGRHWDPP